MNRVAGRTSRTVAGALMLAVAAYGMPISTAATPQGAEIVGNVLGADALTVVPGASVKAAHMATHKIYTSQATGADGVYRLSDLPPGSYDLAVQTSAGLFPADAVVEVKEGRRTMVSLAIRTSAAADAQDKPADPNAPAPQKPTDPNAPAPPQGEKPPEPPPQQPPKKKGGGFWRSPAGAAIAIVGGAALIGVAANSAASDDEEDTDPLTQSGN